jgi:hypothetical protein
MIFHIRDPLVFDIMVDRYIQETGWAPDERSIRKAIRAREAQGQVGYKDTYPVFTRVAGTATRRTLQIPPASSSISAPSAATSSSSTARLEMTMAGTIAFSATTT